MENKAQDDDLVMNLVELALGQPEPERRAYLQRACAGETELFEQAWEYVQWESRMQGFLSEPLYSPPVNEHPFEPGELLDGRFRILREIAQGGMGVVYEAMDERLERRIAIKCAKTGFRKRLPPEVRHARDITHPNVCKLFEIHTARTQAGEIDFVTMEYLEGETLADRLKRGPVPEAEARAVARQLCSGLAEAHSQGVIHGDLKSNNVILTKAADASTRSVITDFGMSRATETAQSTLQSGPRGGTPDYMAPELWRGEKASIASDIYALGVLLYELVSGQRPPQSQEPSHIALPLPAVSPRWNAVLARCLEHDPERRFRTADEVKGAFEPSHTRRRFLAVAASIVLAAASGIFAYQRAMAPKETIRLAVLPFSSTTETAPLAASLVRDAAIQFAGLNGNARTRLAAIPLAGTLRNQVDNVEKARTLLGATHALRGTLTKENDNTVLHVLLTDTRTNLNVREWTARYKTAEVRFAPLALAGIVSLTWHLPPPAVSATVNADARQDYEQGLAYARRDGGVDLALAALERALAADPDSPLTFAARSEVEWLKYRITRNQDWRERATESARQAELRNPDLAPVHRMLGLIRAEEGYYETATAEYLRAIELDPANGDAYRRLGEVYEKNSQLDKALLAFRKAVELDPQQYRNHQDLGNFYLARDDYEEAFKHFRRSVGLAPDEPVPHYVLAVVQTNLGKFQEAERELRTALDLRETADALHQLGLTLMYQGREREAIPYFERALHLKSNWYLSLTWLDLGICYRRIKLIAESESANRKGLAVAEAEIQRDPRNGYLRSFLAYLCARLSDRSRSESEIAQALQLSPNDTGTRWWAVLTYEALGRREATLAFLVSVPDQILADLNRWPDLADLRSDARFMQLAASRQVSR